MLKLKASKHDHSAYSWGWIASTVALAQVNPFVESLHNNWVFLVKVFEDHKSLKIAINVG